MSSQIEIHKDLIKYLKVYGYRQDPIINDLVTETNKLGNVSRMQISSEQGQFLELPDLNDIYEKNRNILFTKDIEKIDILVDSYSIFSSGIGSSSILSGSTSCNLSTGII